MGDHWLPHLQSRGAVTVLKGIAKLFFHSYIIFS